MIEQIVIECVLGGFTGYVTNDIALKQLFKDGGVIEQKKDEFIVALISLLKNDIFSDDEIHKLIEQKEVQTLLHELITIFVKETIPSILSEVVPNTFVQKDDLKAQLEAWFLNKNHLALVNIAGLEQIKTKLLKEGHFETCINQTLDSLSEKCIDDFLDSKSFCQSLEAAVKEALSFDNPSFLKKLEHFYDDLKASDALIGDYFNLDEEVLAKEIILKLRHLFKVAWEKVEGLSLSLGDEENRLKLLLGELLKEVSKKGVLSLGEVLSKEEIFITEAIIEAIKEGTSDLGDGSSELILRQAKTFFAPSWIKREYPNLAESLKELSTLTEIDKFVSSEAFSQVILKLIHGLFDLSIGEFIDSYLTKDDFFAVMKRGLSFLFNACDKTLWVEKLTKRPLSSWLLTEALKAHISQSILKKIEAFSFEERLIYSASAFSGLKKAVIDMIFNVPLSSWYQVFFDETLLNARMDDVHELVQDFLKTHLASLIANVAQDYLESLNQKDVRLLVNDLLGKEMRPLSYLGGVIGFVTGLGLGYFASEAKSDDLWRDVALRSATYGAIGYGTNVLAVHSLFRPHKKVLGWQGLLPKNKRRFARKMGEMTKNYIAKTSIWENYLQSKSQAIKTARFRLKDGWQEKVLKKSLAHFVNEGQGMKVLSLAKPLFENVFADKKVSDELESALKVYLLNLSGRFNSLKSNNGLLYVKDQAIKGLDKWLFDATNDKLSAFFERFVILADEPLAVYFKTIMPVRESKLIYLLVDLLERNLDRILLLAYRYEGALTRFIIKKIKQNLGFRAGLVYRMMSGDRYVMKIVKLFLYEKLPSLLKARQESMMMSIKIGLKERVINQSLYDFDLASSYQLGNFLRDYLSDTHAQERLKVGLLLLQKDYIIAPLKAFDKTYYPHIKIAVSTICFKEDLKNVFLKMYQHLISSASHVVLEKLMHELSIDIDMKSFKLLLAEVGQFRVSDLLNEKAFKRLSLEENKLLESIVSEEVLPIVRHHLNLLIKRELTPVLHVFDLSTVVIRAIDYKDEEALENMIVSIARPYFRRVERMGLFGAFVALPASMCAKYLS